MPQTVPVSTCQRIVYRTSCGTDILASVAQASIVIEAFVLWIDRATLPLVTASFSLGLVERILGTPFPIGCVLFEHVVDNFGQFVGRGCRGLGRPEFTPHAAKKSPEIAGAGTETLRRHAQGATGAILDSSTTRGEHFAAADLIVGTEA